MQKELIHQQKINANLLSISRFGTREDVTRALRAGGDPNARLSSTQSTALIIAADHGNEEAVKALLPVSSPLARDARGWTALMCAAATDHAGCVALLLEEGGPLEVNPKGMSSLALAALDGSIESVLLLLPVSDPSQKNYAGRTASDIVRTCQLNDAKDCRAAFLALEEEREMRGVVRSGATLNPRAELPRKGL